MDLGLKNKKVLITGASQGIGEGAAKVFAAEGADLKLTARRGDVLNSLAANLKRETGVSVETFPIDLELRGAAQKLADAAGDVDILVNNAGVIPGGNLDFVDEKTWRAGWELKVFGYINLCRIYYARMKASGGGVIVNNIGNAGERLDAEYISGTSGNACLMAFTRALGGRPLATAFALSGSTQVRLIRREYISFSVNGRKSGLATNRDGKSCRRAILRDVRQALRKSAMQWHS